MRIQHHMPVGEESSVMVLSHWPHVAEQVQQQLQQLVAELVEQHVASVKALLYFTHFPQMPVDANAQWFSSWI